VRFLMSDGTVQNVDVYDEAEKSRQRELARRRREAGIIDDDELVLSDSDRGDDKAEASRKRELNRRRREAGLPAAYPERRIAQGAA
jgi:hypothetical protein